LARAGASIALISAFGASPPPITVTAPTAHSIVEPATALPGVETDEPAVNYYIVARKKSGEPEFLFELAQRFLGNGDRFTEIFKLNEGRKQPDGRALTDPAVVAVGWVLEMPADAAGKGLQFGPLPTSGPGTAPAPSTGAGNGAPTHQNTGQQADRAVPPVPLIVGAAGIVVLALTLGSILVYRRIRRAKVTGVPFDNSILRTDTSASWIVDRALRVLMSACDNAGTKVPPILGVFIEGPTIRLRLVSPVLSAPVPWTASEDAQNWSASIARLQEEPISSESTAAFARLVTLGVGESGRVLVDFSRARGAISLEGPPPVTHEVLRRWLGELTRNPWSDSPRVVMIGDGLPRPLESEQMSSLEQLVPELETESRGVLILSRPPSSAQQTLLALRFASASFGWIVIVLTSMPTAKWRFTVSNDNTLRSGFLPDVRFDAQFTDRPATRRDAP